MEIVFGIISLLSLIFAIFQTYNMARIKKLQKQHCESRCRNIVSLTQDMTNEVIGACQAFNDEMETLKLEKRKPNFNMPQIAAKISSINVLTSRLINFCREINNEHENEYGYKVFPDIYKELPEHECLINARKKLNLSIQEELK
jgi:hypothetical protein